MATSAPRWQRLEHDERRGQILDCARTLFSERNYAAVSTAEIAESAGIARGLLHHYFGTKRDLYLEVVRSMLQVPAHPVVSVKVGHPRNPRELRAAIEEGAERWLEMVERSRGMWLATHGLQGMGRDAEVEAILEEAREVKIDELIEAVRPGEDAASAPPSLRAVLRAYSGLVEAGSIEWLERGRLSRAQLRALVVEGFFCAVGDLLTAVDAVSDGNANSS
jgi:AcrR family transcriptional regulator